MNCPNCNSNINQGDSFCSICNTKIKIQNQQQNCNEVPNWNITSTQINNIPFQNNNSIQTNNIQNQYNQQNIIENQVTQHNAQSQNQINHFQNTTQINNNQNNNIQNQQQFKPQTVFNTNYSQTILNDDVYKDEMLIDAYIGKRTDKLKKGGFSWCTFFFGIYYVFYRKMWLFGIILWAINIVVGNIIGKLEWLEIIIDLIIGLVAACFFKEKYLTHVTKKVDEIKIKNSDKTPEELVNICKKKGGTSILPLLLIIGIVLVVTGTQFYQNYTIYNKAKDRLDEISGHENTTAIEIIRGELTVTIPSGFEEFTNKADTYSTIYNEYSSNSSCLFYLSTMNATNYKSSEERMKEIKKIFEINNETETKQINGNIWYYTVKGNTYFYTIINKNKVYDIRFTIYEENYKKNCTKNYSDIINSLNFN